MGVLQWRALRWLGSNEASTGPATYRIAMQELSQETARRSLVSDRSTRFTESVIREMTRQILLHHPTDGINLAQGFPDFPAPAAVKDAACAAIQADVNQYAITWGARD